MTTSLEHFFNDIKTGGTPTANYKSVSMTRFRCIMANKAMDEERRVQFSELETMGKGQTSSAPAAAPKKKAGQSA